MSLVKYPLCVLRLVSEELINGLGRRGQFDQRLKEKQEIRQAVHLSSCLEWRGGGGKGGGRKEEEGRKRRGRRRSRSHVFYSESWQARCGRKLGGSASENEWEAPVHQEMPAQAWPILERKKKIETKKIKSYIFQS